MARGYRRTTDMENPLDKGPFPALSQVKNISWLDQVVNGGAAETISARHFRAQSKSSTRGT